MEGKNDISAVKRAVEAEVLVTEGFILSRQTLACIKAAQARCGVIVLTDPDTVGERLRKRIDKVVPGCLHAYLPKEAALKAGDVGIENAAPEAIREALSKVRRPSGQIGALEKAGKAEFTRAEFSQAELLKAGLAGGTGSAEKRAKVGDRLGIGRTNARQFLNRLNHYGISREEFVQVCTDVEEESAKGEKKG